MYKVNVEALLHEFERLEAEARRVEARCREDAEGFGALRGYTPEKVGRLAEFLLAEAEDYAEIKDKLEYLNRFIEGSATDICDNGNRNNEKEEPIYGKAENSYEA